MRWSDEYATGIERIDDQHKMIFQMSEDFRAALDEGHGERVYEDLLQSLERYVRNHFGFEEGCMERCRCPVAEGNKKAHTSFIEFLAGFKQRYGTRGFDRTDARGLVDGIDDWLANHIARIDVQLRGLVEGGSSAGRAVQ